MQIIKNEHIDFFDVDDTLVMHNTTGIISFDILYVVDPLDSNKKIKVALNKPMIRLLKESKSRGFTVVVWSRGGYAWAENVIKALKLENHVDFVMSKPLAYFDDKPVETWMSNRVYLPPDLKYKETI